MGPTLSPTSTWITHTGCSETKSISTRPATATHDQRSGKGGGETHLGSGEEDDTRGGGEQAIRNLRANKCRPGECHGKCYGSAPSGAASGGRRPALRCDVMLCEATACDRIIWLRSIPSRASRASRAVRRGVARCASSSFTTRLLIALFVVFRYLSRPCYFFIFRVSRWLPFSFPSSYFFIFRVRLLVTQNTTHASIIVFLNEESVSTSAFQGIFVSVFADPVSHLSWVPFFPLFSPLLYNHIHTLFSYIHLLGFILSLCFKETKMCRKDSHICVNVNIEFANHDFSFQLLFQCFKDKCLTNLVKIFQWILFRNRAEQFFIIDFFNLLVVFRVEF